jgi:hypothetical protein
LPHSTFVADKHAVTQLRAVRLACCSYGGKDKHRKSRIPEMVTLRITGFLDFCPSSGILDAENRRRFGNLIRFRPQVRGKTPAPFGFTSRNFLNPRNARIVEMAPS